MLRAGVVSATFKKHSAEEVIALASKASLKAIEWSEGYHVPEYDLAAAARISALTSIAGMNVAAFGSYYKLGKGMDFEPRILTAKALGTNVIRIWGGDKPSSELSQEERSAYVEEAKRIACLAAKDGLIVALEWHKNTVTDTNESGLSFLSDVGMDNFRTLWQPTMALSVSERAEGLKALGERVVNIHVYYWDSTGRRPLIEGEADWKKYLERVSGDHYALLEFVKDDSEEQFFQDAGTLLSWI